MVAPAAVLPASVALAWATQARLAGAVAHAYGYCINCHKTRAMIMCAVLGDSLLVRKVSLDSYPDFSDTNSARSLRSPPVSGPNLHLPSHVH